MLDKYKDKNGFVVAGATNKQGVKKFVDLLIRLGYANEKPEIEQNGNIFIVSFPVGVSFQSAGLFTAYHQMPPPIKNLIQIDTLQGFINEHEKGE